MTDDEALLDLRETVAAWERRRLALLSDVMLCATQAERGAVVTEVAFLHGAAFEDVVSAVVKLPSPLPGPAIRALHTAIEGRAVFNAWRAACTSAHVPEHLGPLAALWGGVVQLLERGGSP